MPEIAKNCEYGPEGGILDGRMSAIPTSHEQPPEITPSLPDGQ